ncbi:MAG: hypothetical protein OEV43_02250 [Coriobacteriia bacterium]|nr:hypothetical protein [Coriobacteriia bacterium]
MDPALSHVSVDDIENTLNQVAEIKAARVVVSPEGLIQEIHVLALPTKSPKQLVRDIESTLMARFGVPVDHRKISIAQLGAESMPTGAEAGNFRARIISVNEHVSGVRASVAVVLEIEGSEYIGQASGPASQTIRTRLVAQATLDAAEQYTDGEYSFALEDVAIIQLGKERAAVSCVTLVSPPGEQTYAGSALVRQNEKDSIVRATLDAINRRLGLLTTS